ncbi:TPA: chromosome segregation protein SMC [Candidatus Gastranaerophilales bacterium HUM_18]|nr:MAG TPA: chromosome segregation protein SMC [Candidatus Gastranaerophilales bacterium HUM_18]
MYIKQLEIDNFKSFANKVDIPMLQGFTTISGPNGSGKSNIIDSILFALGLSTSRTLRAEKLFHLISTYNKRNEAFVKVTFGETGEGDFSVARRIRKSSQGFNSIYYLDDKIATLSDIHAKLEKYNITPNSYNVMMQGDVMSITNCTPGERRKIIDEIAGIADFDRRIEQATNELDTVEKRVVNSTLILNEVNTRLEQLKEEKEVALKYQKLKEEKNGLESQINTVKFFDLRRNIEKAHENILEFTKKKKEEELKSKDLEERLKLIKEKYDEISKTITEKGEGHQLELKQKAEEIKGSISRKNSSIVFADKQIQDNLKTIENTKNGIEVQQGKIKDAELKISLKQDEIKGIERNIEEQKAILHKILEDMSGLNETAEKHIEKRNTLRKELEALQDKETKLIQKQAPLEADLSSKKKALEEAREKLTELENFQANFSETKASKELLIEQLGKELDDFKIILKNTLYEYDKTKNEITDMDYDLQAARKKIYQLEAVKQANEDANLGRAVDTVIAANISGVHAPLMKLGQVDEEYSTAMEIAVGGRMAHIVVDDEHVASTCIELLKSSNAGRATFVPLNKIVKCPRSLNLPKEKGVIDFAINLIDFDDEYLNAFYYAVGETLVVEDRSVANKLIGKYRMVTLSGDLFEKSGSITGGAVRKTGLKFAQNSDSEIDTFKSRLKDMESKYAALISKRSSLEGKMEDVRGKYSSSTTEFNKAKLELANLETSFANTQQNIDEKQEFIKVTEPEITSIEKTLDKIEEEHIDISEKMTDVQTSITEVEKLMNDADLKDLKEKTAGVEAEIKRYEKNMADANNEIEGLHQRIDFINTTIKTHNDTIERSLGVNKDLELDKAKFAEEIKGLNEQLEVLEIQIKEITDKLGELLKQRDDINKDLVDIETQRNLKASDIEKIAEQIESFKARRRELEPQLEETRNVLTEAGVNINELTPVEMSIEEITSRIQRLQKRMDDLGAVNMKALEDFENVSARQQELHSQIETLSHEREQILERMRGYEDLKKETFLKTYNVINEHFKDIFHRLSDGEGTLILENEEKPFEGGLDIEAQPRDKKKQRLAGMSGGEKALTALSFVFAIQKYMPAPFYAFDEVDASLDGINVEKLAHIVQSQAETTQFIVVSHRKPMIESANRTIGVTQKEKGISKVTGVKLRD